MDAQKLRSGVREGFFLGLLLLVACGLVGYRFTSRSRADQERERARIMLGTIYRLEQAYHDTSGTYLPIDRKNNGDLLKLNDPPGRVSYRVTVSGNTFVAVARADLDGDGQTEVWEVDPEHPEPVLQNRD